MCASLIALVIALIVGAIVAGFGFLFSVNPQIMVAIGLLVGVIVFLFLTRTVRTI
ncbi:MAG TPA: hypothetical protein VGW38_18965 [Chloroflexota bacterium]|nr:hypothetical protein [Chloroflexota bacterium]